MSRCRAGALDKYEITDDVQYVDKPEAHTFRWQFSPYLRNISTLDIGVLGYIGIV